MTGGLAQPNQTPLGSVDRTAAGEMVDPPARRTQVIRLEASIRAT